MAKKKTKTSFIGLKVTAEEAELLARLQESLGMPTKTEVLLRGLRMMLDVRPAIPSPGPGIVLKDSAAVAQVATSSELARFEAEVRRYGKALEETKNKTREVIRQVVEELSKIDEIVGRYEGDRSALIQVLLELQRESRWLSQDALRWVSRKLGVPLPEVYYVATFYKAFSLLPRGRHSVSVCLGTACQVRGAPRMLDRVTDALKIQPGETSTDMRFSFDTVNCLGCCASGPVMVVDGKYYGKPSTKEIQQVLTACE